MELPKEPIVTIHTTENRGHSPEEVAERCLDKIIQVSESAPPAIREQAYAFRDVLRPEQKQQARKPAVRASPGSQGSR